MPKAKRSKLSRLRKRCEASIPELFGVVKSMGGEVNGKPGEQHAYLDRGSDILAVAHLDYVQKKFHFEKLFLPKCKWIYCPRVDDRLGVFTILDALPAQGIELDILFTENEEVGASTAKDFTTKKKYNWVAEFDRREEDVVIYEYWMMRQHLADFFLRVGTGTSSDICHLKDLGCGAFNVGVGYENEHQYLARFNVETYDRQIKRFIKFYDAFKNRHLEYKKVATVSSPPWKGEYYETSYKDRSSFYNDDYWKKKRDKERAAAKKNGTGKKKKKKKPEPLSIGGMPQGFDETPFSNRYGLVPEFDERLMFDDVWREFEKQESEVQQWLLSQEGMKNL